MNNNTGFSNLGIEIEYDSSVMGIEEVIPNENVGANFTSAESITENPYNMSWDSINDNTYNGSLATVRFKINDDAKVGSYPVSVNFYKGVNGKYTDGEDVNYDENEKPLRLEYKDGAVTVATYISGDINGDKRVNSRDAVSLLRYLAKWNMPDINESALDTNGDGKINNKDATLLLRYIAGWDVELK